MAGRARGGERGAGRSAARCLVMCRRSTTAGQDDLAAVDALFMQELIKFDLLTFPEREREAQTAESDGEEREEKSEKGEVRKRGGKKAKEEE